METGVPAVGNDVDGYIPARYIFLVLGSVGIGIVYGLMVNLPIAMMGMLNYNLLSTVNTAVGVYDDLVRTGSLASFYNNIEILIRKVSASDSTDEPCLKTDQNYLKDLRGPFLWTPEQSGIIISSYFWGYFISQLVCLTGVITYSPKWTMFVGVVINITCTLLTPVLVKLHYFALIVLRILEGIGGGMTIPAFNKISSKWVRPEDKTKIRSWVHTYSLVGIVASTALSGILTAKAGWQTAFYVTGGLSIFWCVPWITWVHDTPKQQPFKTTKDRSLTITSVNDKTSTDEIQPFPWRTIFTSKPVVAILVAHICCNWGWYMLLLELPFYLKLIIKLNTLQVAILLSLAFMCTLIFNIGTAFLLNWMQAKNVINTRVARKMATAFATAIPALSLFLLCFLRCDRTASIVVSIVAIMFTGGMFYGFHSNYDDIAPAFADQLMVVTDAIATVPRLIVPIFVAAMTHGNCKYAYFIVFGVTALSYTVALVTYSLFGNTNEEPWSKHNANKNRTNSNFDLKKYGRMPPTNSNFELNTEITRKRPQSHPVFLCRNNEYMTSANSYFDLKNNANKTATNTNFDFTAEKRSKRPQSTIIYDLKYNANKTSTYSNLDLTAGKRLKRPQSTIIYDLKNNANKTRTSSNFELNNNANKTPIYPNFGLSSNAHRTPTNPNFDLSSSAKTPPTNPNFDLGNKRIRPQPTPILN